MQKTVPQPLCHVCRLYQNGNLVRVICGGERIPSRVALHVVISRTGVGSTPSSREEQKGGADVHDPLSRCRPRV
jgi:hypothetical protein